jgi:hypothetical protein
MQWRLHTARLLPPLCLIGALALLSPSPVSAESDLRLDVVPGFSGFVKPNRWIPLRVSVRNDGKAFRGTLAVEITRGNEAKGNLRMERYERLLDLPSRSRKAYSFVVFVPSFARPLKVRCLAGQKEILEVEVDLKARAAYERLILSLSREINLDFLALLGGSAPYEHSSRIRVIYPLLEYLPDRWDGYDSIDLLIVHNAPLGRLKGSQIRAIDQWVATGGTLVISGGAHLTPDSSIPLRALLPVEVLGYTESPRLSSLEERFGGVIDPNARFLLTVSRPSTGRTLIEEGGLPLIVEELRGKGRILFLAFDYAAYPLSGWQGKRELWSRIVGQSVKFRREQEEESDARFDDSLVYSALNSLEFDLPSHAVLLAFLSLAVGALIVWLKIPAVRRPGSRVMGVVLIVAIMAVSGAFLFHSHLFRGESVTIELTLLETRPGARYASLTKDLFIFSSKKAGYCLTLPHGSFSVVTRDEQDLIVREEETTAITDIQMGRWTTRLFRIRSMAAFPFSASILAERGVLRVTLRNDTPYTLLNSLMVYQGYPYSIGDLKSGDRIEETFRTAASSRASPSEISWKNLVPPEAAGAELKRGILQHTLGDNGWDLLTKNNGIVLFGWLEQDLLPVSFHRHFLRHPRLTLVAVIVKLQDYEVL